MTDLDKEPEWWRELHFVMLTADRKQNVNAAICFADVFSTPVAAELSAGRVFGVCLQTI